MLKFGGKLHAEFLVKLIKLRKVDLNGDILPLETKLETIFSNGFDFPSDSLFVQDKLKNKKCLHIIII